MPRWSPDSRFASRTWSLSVRTVLLCLLIIAVADFVEWRWQAPYAVKAALDEPAHVATGLVALAAIGIWFDRRVVLAVVAGSLLIDLDHLPELFGSHVFEHGVPRPYTHSLGTILILLVVALALSSGRRRLLLVATAALALHFVRDIAEPGGPGVALLWPLSDHATTMAYGWYAGGLGVLTAIAIERRRRAGDQAASLVAISSAGRSTTR